MLLFVLHGLTGSLAASVVGARVTSAGVNYATNRRFVFRRGGPTSAPRYAALVAVVLAANWVLMHTLVVVLGTGLLLGKLVTEGLLLFVSYAVQQRFVFARRAGTARSAPRRPLGTAAADAASTASAARASTRATCTRFSPTLVRNVPQGNHFRTRR